MKLSIYSLKQTLFQGEAESINCKTTMGEITVLDNHQPLVSMLTPGVMRVTDTKKGDYYFDIISGFLEVQEGSNVRLLVDSAHEGLRK